MEDYPLAHQRANQTLTEETSRKKFSRESLDIVQDCIDLKGQFPNNVSFQFLLWVHGSYETKDAAGYMADAELLLPHIMGADIVAQEDTGFTISNYEDMTEKDRERLDVPSKYDALNQFNSGNLTESEYREFIMTNGFGLTNLPYLMSLMIRDTPNGKLPIFIPVDIWDDGPRPKGSIHDLGNHDDSLSYHEGVSLDAQSARYREVRATRQLYQKAIEIADDDQPHKIVIIYGAAHNLLPIAMQALGANVGRKYIEKRDNISELARRRVRFADYSENIETELRTLEAIDSIIDEIITLAHYVRRGRETEASVFGSLYRGLNMLALASLNQQLTKDQQERYKQNVIEILEIISVLSSRSLKDAIAKRRLDKLIDKSGGKIKALSGIVSLIKEIKS